MSSLLHQLNEQLSGLLEREHLHENDAWCALVAPEAGAPRILQHKRVEDLAEELRTLVQAGPAWYIAFRGQLVPMEGNPRAGVLDLLLPDGTRVPVLQPAIVAGPAEVVGPIFVSLPIAAEPVPSISSPADISS